MSEASFPTTLPEAVRFFGAEAVCRDFRLASGGRPRSDGMVHEPVRRPRGAG